jgi:flagellar biosynthesis/type III secretory pathway protein FliH
VAKNSSPKSGQDESVQVYEPARFDSGSIVFNRRTHDANKEKLAKIEKEAFDKGYAEGIRAGSQTISAVSQRLDSVIRELESFRAKKTEELVPDIIDLSIAIAKKIIHANIEKNRENVITIAREALSKLGGTEEKILIRVNPDDYDTMLSNLDSLRGETRLMDITIEPSAVITPGGCFIETPSGEVDARIEEMIKEIGDAIATASTI